MNASMLKRVLGNYDYRINRLEDMISGTDNRPIDRVVEMISRASDDTNLGQLVDQILMSSDYDPSMAEGTVAALYDRYGDQLNGLDKEGEGDEKGVKEQLQTTLTAIPMNECHLTVWNCVPIFASDWYIHNGSLEASGTLMYLHNASRSNWLPFTRGIGKINCENGNGSLATYTYNNPDTANVTFKANAIVPAEIMPWKIPGGDDAATAFTDIEIHPTASTRIEVTSATVELARLDGQIASGMNKTIIPGYIVNAVINMDVNTRAALSTYMADEQNAFTFRGILTLALQNRLDTAIVRGLFDIMRDLPLTQTA